MSVLSPEATPDKALRIFATLVRDQEVGHFVPFVPVGWDRWLQRVEGASLI
jgi:hypothetical protein